MRKLFLLSVLIILVLTLVGCGKDTTQYTLTIKKEGKGEVTPSEGKHQYNKSTIIDITAITVEGWQFKEWIGEVAESESAETTVLIDKDKTVCAVFEQKGEGDSDIEYVSTKVVDFSLSVACGTSEEDALANLITTVGVRGTNDEEGIATIKWIFDNYEAETEGYYTTTGVVTLPEGWIGNPVDLTATVTVLALGSANPDSLSPLP